MEKTSLLENYDYAIVSIGYVHRIPKKLGDNVVNKINDMLKIYDDENHLVYMKGDYIDEHLQTRTFYVLYGNENDYHFINGNFDYDGIIVLKNINLNNAYSLVNGFASGSTNEFCAFCSISNIYKLESKTINDKKILFVHVDTESG